MDSGEAARSGSSHLINGAALTQPHSAAVRRDAPSRLVRRRSPLIDGTRRPLTDTVIFLTPSSKAAGLICALEDCRTSVEVHAVQADGFLEMFSINRVQR